LFIASLCYYRDKGCRVTLCVFSAPWWDNVETKNRKESRSEILSKSFKETIAVLENQLGKSVPAWTWNKVHVVEYEHALGKVALLRSI
jgi:penicillin amidase